MKITHLFPPKFSQFISVKSTTIARSLELFYKSAHRLCSNQLYNVLDVHMICMFTWQSVMISNIIFQAGSWIDLYYSEEGDFNIDWKPLKSDKESHYFNWKTVNPNQQLIILNSEEEKTDPENVWVLTVLWWYKKN